MYTHYICSAKKFASVTNEHEGQSGMQNHKEQTPCSRVLLQKLTVTHLAKKCSIFYWTRFTVFTTAHQ